MEGTPFGLARDSRRKGSVVIRTLAGLKRVLRPGVVVTLLRRERPPSPGGVDATGIPRRVVQVQNNAVAFEPIRPHSDKPSWLYWPKAGEVSFALEAPGAAQLFTMRGLTYRIESCQGAEAIRGAA